MTKFKIVGLGALGTHLAYCLCNTKKCTEIEVYDFDILSEKDLLLFPFYGDAEGINKALAFEALMLIMHPDIKVTAHSRKFENEQIMEEGWIIIDCRDVKTLDVDFNFRISFDGGRLIFDARLKENIDSSFYRDTDYVNKPDINAYLLAAAHCCEYIDSRLFESKEITTPYNVFKKPGVFKRR